MVPTASAEGIVLYQFPASHFNEKVRWALDRKRVPHRRVSLMPGPHVRTVRRLTGGSTATPVLVHDGRVIPGSAAILAHLETVFPERPLLPEPGPARERALAIQREFDEEVGPAVRLARFHEVMSAGYATWTFCRGKPRLVRGLYRALFPLVEAKMKRQMGIDAERAAEARERTRRALDFVAKEGAGGYLVADRFGLADLACAALLMPAVDVSDLGGPAAYGDAADRAWLARWADHPGALWVREIYRRHRRG